MQAGQVLDRLLRKICPDMHKLRRTALFVNVMAALHGAVLTVTHLGRAISSDAKEKHCIKRADRLLSNRRLQRERLDVYSALTRQLIGSKQRPVLLVDWSDMDECKRHFLLRASVPVEGRALTVYEEVHTLRTKRSRRPISGFCRHCRRCCRRIVVPSWSPMRGFAHRGSNKSRLWAGTGWVGSAIAIRCNFVGRRRGSPVSVCMIKPLPHLERSARHA